MSAYTAVTVHAHRRAAEIAAALTELAARHDRSAAAQTVTGSNMLDSHNVVLARFNHADPNAILDVVKNAAADGAGYTPESVYHELVSVSMYDENAGRLSVHLLDRDGDWSTLSVR